MKIVNIDQDSPEWLEFRKGKITGSKLGSIYAKRGGKKIGLYELIAEKLALDPDEENVMDRGHRLELEAIDMFTAETGLEVDTKPGMWVSDLNDAIAISPDGAIKNAKGVYTEAVEVKCLGSAKHIQAIIENKIAEDYRLQVMQYFIVNDDLETLYFVFYDPRIPARPFHMIEFTRKDLEDEIVFYRDYETQTLEWVNEWVERLAF